MISNSLKYELQVVQAPERGRMSGFANPKDVRIIGPHLITRAVFYKGDERIVVLPEKASTLVCKAVLLEISPDSTNAPQISNDANFLGNTTTCCSVLQDLTGEFGMFFIFPDLGVRAPGQYRIKCFLIDVQLGIESFPVRASCETNLFEIHSPKTFPGTLGLTPLSRCFSEQGVVFNISKRIKYS
ncbi:velvet factor [Gorgonomyces haynaldii]|nr:velvet factor [Gorgonomyces haynaldii]